MLGRWLLVVGMAGILTTLILRSELSHSPFHDADKQHQHNDANNKRETGDNHAGEIEVVLWSIIDPIERHHDAVIALGTLGLMFFTGTLWWATRGLQTFARIQSRDTQRSIMAAERAAIAAERSINAIEKAERRQLRAYVGVCDIRFDFAHLSELNWQSPDPIPPEGYIYEDKILVSVKNFGESPAYELRIQINRDLLYPFGTNPSADFEFTEYAQPLVASASQVLDKGQIFIGTVSVSKMLMFQEAFAKLGNLYLYGRIFYTDVYGRRWRREYCFIYEPWRREGERLVPHTGHNDETYVGQRTPKLPA